ncbi:hypothetical protein CRP_006 [Candidatus Carsonella ruddii PV]|uniref:Uncharacterized protein n=2 Tax=Carsonella ruddii TaxID=114186 RepID=Q9AHX3_CARRU|nr:hypothetical protein [Candidatus Carsonella ruddii]AAK17108.1 unknown [Candidatus Carsonella ruddii]BAF35037.1 hypothetical protein CRP_006 [Candidatus Carsonella ruddii PV]
MFKFINRFLNLKKRYFYIFLINFFYFFNKCNFIKKKKIYKKIITKKFENYLLKLIIQKYAK